MNPNSDFGGGAANSLLALSRFIEAILPIQIVKYQRQGGPTQADYEQVPCTGGVRLDTLIETICTETDHLFGGANLGMPGKVAGQIVDALAIASFDEGGALQSYRGKQIQEWIKSVGEATS